MTSTWPCLRMTRHFSHIGRTLGLTFTGNPPGGRGPARRAGAATPHERPRSLSPALLLALRFAKCEYPGAVRRHRDGVLAVGGEAAVAGEDGPAVGPALDVVAPRRDHRLDREHHPRRQLRAAAGRPVVRDLRVLVHAAADAVADEASDDAEAASLDDLLDGVAHVAQPVSLPALLDRGLQAEVARLDQIGGLLGGLADG